MEISFPEHTPLYGSIYELEIEVRGDVDDVHKTLSRYLIGPRSWKPGFSLKVVGNKIVGCGDGGDLWRFAAFMKYLEKNRVA